MEVLFLDTLLKYRFRCIEVIAGRKKEKKEKKRKKSKEKKKEKTKRKKEKEKKYNINIFIFLYYCTALYMVLIHFDLLY